MQHYYDDAHWISPFIAYKINSFYVESLLQERSESTDSLFRPFDGIINYYFLLPSLQQQKFLFWSENLLWRLNFESYFIENSSNDALLKVFEAEGRRRMDKWMRSHWDLSI